MYKLSLPKKYLNLKINTSQNQPFQKLYKKKLNTKSPKVYFYSFSSKSYYLANLDNHKNIFRQNRHFKVDFYFKGRRRYVNKVIDRLGTIFPDIHKNLVLICADVDYSN